MTGAAAAPHVYISTACHHGEHGKCRNTCKYCDAPCACRECDHASARDLPELWVDQARGIAAELYALLGPDALPGELRERISTGPALFWLRGETMPPGEWRAPEACASEHDQEQ